MNHGNLKKDAICVFCQKPVEDLAGEGWIYGDEEFGDFMHSKKLGFVCYAHRTCHTIMVDPFTKEIDERLYKATTDAKHAKVLLEWERVVASIIRVVHLKREGVSIRKIAEKLNVSMYFVRQALKCLKQL